MLEGLPAVVELGANSKPEHPYVSSILNERNRHGFSKHRQTRTGICT